MQPTRTGRSHAWIANGKVFALAASTALASTFDMLRSSRPSIVTVLVALDERQRNLKTCVERVAAIVPIGIGCECVANIASDSIVHHLFPPGFFAAYVAAFDRET